jgi:hypothetical protein
MPTSKKKKEPKKPKIEEVLQPQEETLDPEDVVETDSGRLSDEVVVHHVSEDEARSSVYQGALDMQNALFSHASFTSSRLVKVRSLLGKVEARVFDDQFLEDLDKKEMLKLYELIKSTEKDSLDFLERTHKIVQDSSNVMKVTSTIVTNRANRGGTPISHRIDRNLLSAVKQRILENTDLAQDAIDSVHQIDDGSLEVVEEAID